MLFRVNGFQVSNLQKAKDDSVITVDIIANHLTEDSEGETILQEAFDKEAVDSFLTSGLIDYWHDSENPSLTKEARNAAIIGKPIAFRWDSGKPIVTAQLTKSHPIVKNMIPHLEADQPVYAASVSGSKMVIKTQDSQGGEHRIIPKIKWTALAIAPANSVINRGSGLNVKLLRKANDILCEFEDVNSFRENYYVFEKEEALKKALEAPGSVSDMQNTSGGVITKQSLEKKPVNLTLSEQDGLDFIDTIIGIKKKTIPTTQKEYMEHFRKQKKEDFGRKSYGLIDKYFKLKKEQK